MTRATPTPRAVQTVYGKTAIDAVTLLSKNGSATTPLDAWKAAVERNTASPASRNKCCPKNAFLGLFSAGAVRGVGSPPYPQTDNGEYAVSAWRLLRAGSFNGTTAEQLWRLTTSVPRKHNGQMNVVLALWDARMLVRE